MRNPIIQPHQEGNQRLPGMDAALYVRPKSWGDLDHFKERLDFLCTQETWKIWDFVAYLLVCLIDADIRWYRYIYIYR